MFIRITKLGEAPDTGQAIPVWNAFAPDPGRALPVGYTVEGLLAKPLKIDSPIVLLRMVRNGIIRPGIFTSTEVREIRIITRNSVYRIETLADAWEPQPPSFRPCQS